MAKLNGVAFTVEIETGVGPFVWKRLASETSCSLTVAFSEIDVTDKSSGDFGDYLAGLGNGDCPFEGFYETTPVAATQLSYQDLLALAGPNKPVVNVRIRIEGGATDVTFTFPSVITQLDITAATNEGVTVSGNFKLKARPIIGTATV